MGSFEDRLRVVEVRTVGNGLTNRSLRDAATSGPRATGRPICHGSVIPPGFGWSDRLALLASAEKAANEQWSDPMKILSRIAVLSLLLALVLVLVLALV